MPQNDKIQSLYEDVKKDYEVGTLEDFKTYLSDDKKRAAFFKDVVQPNYEVKDISEFESIYDLKKKVQNTPTTSNGLENSSTQELGSSGKTKTVEEFNAKYGTNYTDLKTGQTKVDNAEKGVLVPFSPIKVKQPSGEKDFIAPKVQLPDLTKAPMKRYEKAYDGITGRIDNNTKEFDKVTAEAEKQGKELEGTVNKYNNELKQASTVIQNELKAKYEGLLKAGSISVEDANLKLQEEYKKGYGIAEKQITSKYKPSLDSYTSLLDKRKTLSNSINGDIERAKLLSNSVGIIERNVNAQNVSEYNNLENLTVSGLSMLGSAMSGSLPFFLRFTNNNLAEFAAKNNMPELSKVALEKQTDLEKSELLQKMEAYAKEQAQKGSYYSNKITEKEGTLVDNFSQGNYAQAGKVAGLRFLESIPMMGAAIGMTALTGGTASAIIPGGFMFGSQNYYGEYANRPDMSETDKLNASFVKGSLEMITELSVMPLLSPLKSLIKTGGKEAVREAVEKTLFNSMKEGYGKLVPYFGWVQEGLSEYANEVGSTITDKILDPKFQDKDWGEVIKEANVRGLEAFGPGAFGGVTLTLPVAINNTINKYQNKKMAREFASELEKIEVDIQNPNLTEAQKDILIARKQEIHGKLNEVFDADKQETAGATTEQISALDDINDQQDEVAVALQDETISDESKVAFEEKAKELAEQEKAVLEEIKANEIVNEEKPNTADNGLSNDVVEPNVETSSSPSSEVSAPSDVAGRNVNFTAKGGNKVVDEKGEPLIVYHGTNKEFDKLDVDKPQRGLFFTKDKQSAKSYANKKGDGGGAVKEAIIILKNPHIIDAKGKSYDEIIVDLDKVDMATGKGVSKKMTTDEIVDALRGRRSEKIITSLYGTKEKADGIIIKNVRDNFTKQGEPTDIYIPFSNEQISEQPLKETTNEQPTKTELPSSDKGTQTTEPTKQEGEAKGETKEVPPVVEQTTTDVGGVKTPSVSEALKDVESTAKALEANKGNNVSIRPILREDLKTIKPKELVVSKNINTEGDYNFIGKGEKVTIQVQYGEVKPSSIIINTKNRVLNGTEILNAEAAERLRGETKGNEITDFIYAANGVSKLFDINPIEIIGQKSKEISEAYHADKAAGKETELTKAVEELLAPKTNDKENTTRVQSNEREGQEPIKTKPNETTSGEKTETSGILQKEEVDKVANTIQTTPKNVKDLYNTNKKLFGLNRVQSLASAIAMDRMIGAMAKRALITKSEMYGRLKFEKASEQNLPQGVKLQVDAWHGSPYEFDKFTTEKIGTGEGAQAFGWGLYFTDLESIARSYADKLSETKVSINGEIVSQSKDFALFKAAYGIANLGYEKALQRNIELQKEGYWGNDVAGKKISQEIIDNIVSLRNQKVEFIKDKSIYKVSLHKGKSPEQYTWLEWDKNVPKEIVEKLKSVVESYPDGFVKDELSDELDYAVDGTVSEFYRRLSKILESPQDASLLLLENGVDGIKYPAESIARGATSDTARGFNYVVFDENAVSIEEVIKFQKDSNKARGAMMISMDGQAVIYALTDPNVSTPLHELAHVFEHYLTESEKQTVIKNAGTKGWTIETSEYFARGFEKYLSEGKSPIEALNKVFAKFKEWLKDIYNGIKGSDIDIKLNKPMRDIYKTMLGAKVEKNESGIQRGIKNTDLSKLTPLQRVVVALFENLQPESYIEHGKSHSRIEGIEPKKNGKINPDAFKIEDNNIYLNYTREGAAPIDQVVMGVMSELGIEDYDIKKIIDDAMEMIDSKSAFALLREFGGEISNEEIEREAADQAFREEQAEYDAMSNPKDKVERQKIYDKYDKLITPLLEKEKEQKERTRKIELLDTEKKIAQIEKEIRKAPIRGSKGQLSQRQLRTQLNNYKDQLRELKGLQPKKKITDSVLRIAKRNFTNTVKEENLNFDERLILSAIGTIDANDKDIISSDANAQLRKQGALVKKGGLSIDQIVTDFINENDLDPDMAQDFRNTLIDFVNNGDAYAWMNKIKEREAELDPEAVREDELYNYAYEQAIENDLTDEEINEIELELIKYNELTQEEYEKIRNEFSDNGTEEGTTEPKNKANEKREKGAAEIELDKQIEAAKERLAKAKKTFQEKSKEFGGRAMGDLFGKTEKEGLFDIEIETGADTKAIKPYKEAVLVAQKELDELQDPKRRENAVEFDKKQNKLELDKSTDFGKAISASSRFKPYETIIFDKPIIGPNGNKLVSYQWSYEWTMKENSEGELVDKRISDWTQAQTSAETGRDIVHKFTVEKKDGTMTVVSSETIPSLLGYTNEKQMSSLPTLVTAVKTLAKQKMQLAILEAQIAEYNKAKEEVNKMPLPPIKLKKYEEGDKHGGRTVWEMGDQKVWQSDEGAYNPTTGKSEYKRPTEISKERKEVLMDGWKKKRLEELGVKMPYGVEDLKNRITRQEKKVNQITENEFNLEEDAELIELKKQLKAAKLTSDKKVIQEKIDILLEKQPKSKQSRFVPQASEGVKQKQQSIIEKLKQAFPNIEIVQDEEQLNEVLAKSGARQMNNNGVVYGAIYNGKIYLNPTAIRLDTPIHEFGHIWLDIAKNKYAEYYNNLINTIKATPYFEEAKLAYPDLTETQQAEEAVVQAIAEKGIEQLEAQDKKGVLRKVFDTIKAMGKAILKGLGIKNDMNFLKATWQDLVNKAAQDILSGKPITYATSEDIANMDIDAYPISIEGGLLDTSRKGVDRFISKLTGKKFEGLIPYLREMFKVGGNYPEVKKLDQKRIGAISKYMKQIEGTIFEFRGIMKAWSKGKTDAEINKAIQAMQVALTKSVDALAMRNIPQEFIPIIIRMRSNVDGFSQLLLDSGFIDPNTELAASISANLGVYMNRSYAAFVDDKWNEMMFPDNKKRTPIMEKIYKDAYNFIRNQYDNFVEVDGELYTLTTDGNGNITGIVDSMENPVPDPFQMFADPDLLTKIQKAYNNKEKLTVDEINNILKEFARFNKDNQFGKGGKIGKMDLSLFKKRQDIADPLRAFLGEYTEPQAMYINTMTKMAEYIENQKFLADLKKVGEGKIFFDKPVGDYNIEITGQKEYSPLSGLYTSEQINNALKVNNHELLNPDNTLVKIWYGINGFIKFGFTGLSVKSQVRNFGSNIFIGFVNGYYNPYTRVKNDIQNPFKLAWSELNKEGGDELAELAKYGVLESSAIGGELRDIVKLVFKDAYSREFNSPENAFEWFTEKSAEVTSKFLNKAADVYKLGDNVHKIFAYYAELATVKYMFPNKTIEEQKAIAADRFNAVNINYGMVPEVIQYLRKNPIIAAFPTFAAEAVRITYNIPALAMSDIKQGMKSKNQQQISVGVNRLSFFTLGMTAVSLIPYFVGKSVGADDDDEQLIRATSPDYAKNTPKVIVAKKDGTNYEVMDLSWQNPLNMPQIAYTSFKNSNESALKSFTTSTLEVLKPFISSEISTKIIVDVATNDNGSGFKIYNKEDNFWNQTKSISDYIYTQARPGIVKEITNIYKGATDREEFGRKYDLASELKQTATGTKIYNIDAVKKLSSMSYKYQSIFEQDYKLYGSVKSEKSNTPDYTERVEKAYEKANKRYAERQQEVINYIQLLQKKGVPDIEIYEKIKSIGGPYNRNLAKKLIYGQIDQFEK